MRKKLTIILVSCLVALALLIGSIIGIVYAVKHKKNNDGTGDNSTGNEPVVPPKTITAVQELNYNESNETILNPDQGFYTQLYSKLLNSDSRVDNLAANFLQPTQLYHLRVDLSAFSDTYVTDPNFSEDQNTPGDLSQSALDFLDNTLSTFNQNGRNAVVRFSYDTRFKKTDGTTAGYTAEPSDFNQILTHINQLAPILNKYPNTITALEAGLLGYWGEMTSGTKYGTTEYINQVIDAWLTKTNNIQVSVRTPAMIYNYINYKHGTSLNSSNVNTYTVESTSPAYRLGLFNDGFLSSENDLGTYLSNEEKEFIKNINSHLLFGGEIGETELSWEDRLYRQENGGLNSMQDMHLTYLSKEWWPTAVNYFNDTNYTGSDTVYNNPEQGIYTKLFNYIQNHMGYRFVLTNSEFSYLDNFSTFAVKLNITNKGFGHLKTAKNVKLIFVDENENKTEYNVGQFNGETEITYNANISNLANGNYRVYLCLYGNTLFNEANYCVRFANQGNGWSTFYKANLVGNLVVNK